MSQKIVLIGAGSANFGLEAISDIYKSKTLEGSEIVLHDTDQKALKETQEVADKYKEKWGVNFKVSSATSRKDALKGATVVVISIEVTPRFGLWDQDWKIPQQYGMKQIYAENGGPGGLFHSLRVIPPIIEICDDISQICPDAYVFNFSNPMQRICHAVSVKFPDLKFIGLCHAIAEMERDLPELLDTDFSNIEYRAGGLNHISILIDVKYKDSQKDAYPLIRKKALQYYKNYIIDFEKMNEQSTSPGAERGIFLNPTLGFSKRTNLLKVSEGLGNHLPEPCSEQLGPLDTIVPAGNKKISTNLKLPCSFFWTSSNSISDFCIPSKVLGGKILAYSILLAILRTSFAKVDAISCESSNSDLYVLISSLISFIALLYSGLWFLNLKNSSLIIFNSFAAASNFNPFFVSGIIGISIVCSTAVPDAPHPPCFFKASILLFSSSTLFIGG